MCNNLFCFTQVPRPKAKVNKREQAAPHLLELLANDRQSQAGHMLNNLRVDSTALVREVSALHAYLCTCNIIIIVTNNDNKKIPFSHPKYGFEILKYQNVTRQP